MALGRNPMAVDEPRPAAADQEGQPSGWLRRGLILLYAFLSFTVGLMLIFFPWLNLWEHNYFASWSEIWNNSYTRGAVSGLGLINLSIGFGELARLFRDRDS